MYCSNYYLIGRLKKIGRILISDSPFSRNVGFKNPTYAADRSSEKVGRILVSDSPV